MSTTQDTIRMLRRGTGRRLCPLRCESPNPDCRCLTVRLAANETENPMTRTTPTPPEPFRALDGDLSGIATPNHRPAPPMLEQQSTLNRIIISLVFVTAAAGLSLAIIRAIWGMMS